MKEKNFNESSTDGNKSSEKERIIELSLDDIQNLPLIDNDFFLFAANDNKEFADVYLRSNELIKKFT